LCLTDVAKQGHDLVHLPVPTDKFTGYEQDHDQNEQRQDWRDQISSDVGCTRRHGVPNRKREKQGHPFDQPRPTHGFPSIRSHRAAIPQSMGGDRTKPPISNANQALGRKAKLADHDLIEDT
jgi:hypothetical protein